MHWPAPRWREQAIAQSMFFVICGQTLLDSWFTVSHRRGAGGSAPGDASTQMDQMTQNPASRAADRPSPWWTPARHADVRPFLAARGAITRALRAWFDEQGFAEVETRILHVSPRHDPPLHAPPTPPTPPPHPPPP